MKDAAKYSKEAEINFKSEGNAGRVAHYYEIKNATKYSKNAFITSWSEGNAGVFQPFL